MSNKEKLTIDCPHCKQRFSISKPETEVLNTPRVSMIVAAHPKPVLCLCGGYSVIGITFYQAQWAPVAIDEKQAAKLDGSKVIVATAEALGMIN